MSPRIGLSFRAGIYETHRYTRKRPAGVVVFRVSVEESRARSYPCVYGLWTLLRRRSLWVHHHGEIQRPPRADSKVGLADLETPCREYSAVVSSQRYTRGAATIIRL